MYRFSDEHKMIRKMVRRWATEKLEPRLDALEAGEPPYELMRDFARTFGIPDLVRSSFAKMEQRAAEGTGNPVRMSGLGGGDPAMGMLLSIELSRVSPGFMLAFGASMGLAGGAIMGKGTLEQKKRWGLPILTWDKIGAWGMTEPGAGSDAFRSMRTVAIITGPIYIGLALTAPDAIATLFGEKWMPMAPIVAGLALIMPLRSLEIICAPATNATGRPRIDVYTSLMGAVLFTTGFWIGVDYGALGLVQAWWVAAPLLLAFTLALTFPIAGVSAWEWFRSIWPAIVGCAAMAAAVLALEAVLPDWPAPFRLAAMVATGALTYSAVIWFGWRSVVQDSWAMVRQRPASVPKPGDRIQTTAG